MKTTNTTPETIAREGSADSFLVASDAAEESGDMLAADQFRAAASLRKIGASPLLSRLLGARGYKVG